MTQSKISIRNFNFFYGDKQAVFGLNLEVPKNEILSVFGPANSGITTLLRSINRMGDLVSDTRVQGSIQMDGKSVYDPEVNVTELRRKIGMVFDVPTPLPMSIFDNIAYGPRLSGVKNKKILTETVEDALRKAALWDEVKDRQGLPAASLSGGQQQRLCMARALALAPEVLLLDRPCSGLDPISTAKIEESLKVLKEQFTIVIAPHNIQQALRISDRAAFMLSGRLVEDGLAKEIFSKPKNQQTNDYITGRFG